MELVACHLPVLVHVEAAEQLLQLQARLLARHADGAAQRSLELGQVVGGAGRLVLPHVQHQVLEHADVHSPVGVHVQRPSQLPQVLALHTRDGTRDGTIASRGRGVSEGAWYTQHGQRQRVQVSARTARFTLHLARPAANSS